MARTKKSRTMRGKLGKTGSKEQLKEQRKAQKSKTLRRFEAKKKNQRKEQAQRKLERLGLAPPQEEVAVPVRPRRFTFMPKDETLEVETTEQVESNELTVSDLMDAFSETE